MVFLLLHCNLGEKPGQENGCWGRISGNIFGDSEKVLGLRWYLQGDLVGGYAMGALPLAEINIEMIQMEKVTGIGGVFFRSNEPKVGAVVCGSFGRQFDADGLRATAVGAGGWPDGV